jgi:lysophospholipase L1-like esterase
MAARGTALLGLVCALLVLELGVRHIYTLRQTDEPGYGLITTPGTTVVWRREGHGVSHWAARGIRDAPHPAGPRPAIVVLGDSQTEALMVDDDEVFTALLEMQLHRANPASPRILNAGRSSASLADYVAHAERFERLFHPRWVVIVLQEADLESDSFAPTKTHFIRANDGTLTVAYVPPRPRSGIDAAFWELRQDSMLLGYAVTRIGELRTASAAEPPLFFAGVAPEPRASAPRPDYPVEEELDLVARQYAHRVSFLLLATFDPNAPTVPTALERRFLSHCRQESLHCTTPRATYPDLARAGLAPYGHANTRFNYGHLNRDGHRAVADTLARHVHELEANGLL